MKVIFNFVTPIDLGFSYYVATDENEMPHKYLVVTHPSLPEVNHAATCINNEVLLREDRESETYYFQTYYFRKQLHAFGPYISYIETYKNPYLKSLFVERFGGAKAPLCEESNLEGVLLRLTFLRDLHAYSDIAFGTAL